MDEHWHLTDLESIGGHRTEIVSAPELVDIEAGPALDRGAHRLRLDPREAGLI